MAPIPQDAVFATLLMTDSYLPGAMVLAHSLRDRGAKAKLVALVVLEKLAAETVAELQTIYDDIVPVQQIINVTPANLYLMGRPDLISTFTKIELWRQTQYRRIVYLDADMVAIRCPNELLVLDTKFAAVPDVGWPDIFNSGLMVLNPNLGDYYSLLALARRGISFDGADQGLLNMHFVDWERLSFVYNCTPSANYQYAPAYRHFQSSIAMIHFIGAEKPWNLGRDNRHNNGIFGELLGRWWTVYDRHYRRPKTMYQPGQFIQAPKKVQDYVHGEETMYEQIYQSQPALSQQYHPQTTQSSFDTGQHLQPRRESGAHDSRESSGLPFHDQPSHGTAPTQGGPQTASDTQTAWSAPHTEWEPTRQPPPQNSKPEAANFPTQQYEMSHSTQLFEPPSAYPDPPKDMWYQVPEKPKPQPPRTIFPWEERAPKATRVFPRSREPSPPPSSADSAPTLGSPLHFKHEAANVPRKESITSPPAPPPKPPSPPRHVFPWESRAPKATRVFPQEQPPPPPPTMASEPQQDHEEAPSMTTDATDRTIDSVASPRAPEQTWESFQQRPNVWDDMPEISKYMEQINKPRRGKIQVLHHTPSQSVSSVGAIVSPSATADRRGSLIITDFPTKDERPSLPVTPAPIRRPSFWGEEKEDQGLLPGVDGVPKQDQWVRQFTSYPSPAFPAALQSIIDGVLHIKCQHCGKQNPIARLEELSRRQNELLAEGASSTLDASRTPPKREMPESATREEAEEATIKGILGPLAKTESTTAPRKPILREPHFELTDLKDEDLMDEEKAPTPNRTSPPQVRTPTRFSPFVLEGEAASAGAGA